MTQLTTWALERLDTTLDRTALAVDAITLFNRDESVNYDSGRRVQELDLTAHTVVGVGSLDKDSEFAGAGGRERRATSGLSIRVEGAHVDAHGHVPDGEAFEALGDAVEAVLLEYRNVPPSPYHVLRAPDRTRGLSDHADYYRSDIEVRVRGYESTPDAVDTL